MKTSTSKTSLLLVILFSLLSPMASANGQNQLEKQLLIKSLYVDSQMTKRATFMINNKKKNLSDGLISFYQEKTEEGIKLKPIEESQKNIMSNINQHMTVDAIRLEFTAILQNELTLKELKSLFKWFSSSAGKTFLNDELNSVLSGGASDQLMAANAGHPQPSQQSLRSAQQLIKVMGDSDSFVRDLALDFQNSFQVILQEFPQVDQQLPPIDKMTEVMGAVMIPAYTQKLATRLQLMTPQQKHELLSFAKSSPALKKFYAAMGQSYINVIQRMVNK